MNFVLIFLVCWFILCYGAASPLLLWEFLFYQFLFHLPQGYCSHFLSWWIVSVLLSSLHLCLSGYSTRLLLFYSSSHFVSEGLCRLVWWSGILFLSVSDISSCTLPFSVPVLCAIIFLDFRDSVLVVLSLVPELWMVVPKVCLDDHLYCYLQWSLLGC